MTGPTGTTLRTCKYCRVRITFLRTAEGKKMPPINYAPDPQGTIAASQTTTGAWIGRFLARGEDPVIPEKRYAQHWCQGLERQRQRGNWSSANGQLARARRQGKGRRRPRDIQPGMFRLLGDPSAL